MFWIVLERFGCSRSCTGSWSTPAWPCNPFVGRETMVGPFITLYNIMGMFWIVLGRFGTFWNVWSVWSVWAVLSQWLKKKKP